MLTLSVLILSCGEYVADSGEIYVETTGVFDAQLVETGNFTRQKVYVINQYCISTGDLSSEDALKLKGRRVLVRGTLKIVKGFHGQVKSSADGRIYEPLVEPDLLFIINPRFTILD